MVSIEDLRSLKDPLFNMVVFDWVATVLSAIIIRAIFGAPIIDTLIILLILSIVLHVVFDIPTKTNYYLGLSKDPRPIES